MTVRETFELDWSQALRGADQLDRALSQASARFHNSITRALSQLNTTVKVSADARGVAGAITAAVENADSTVEVTAEAAPVTGAIDAAVENANTHVEITGDASQLTGAVNSALADAKKSSAEVSDSIGGAAGNATLLAGGLTKSGSALKAIGGIAATVGIGAFLKNGIDAASDLAESFNKANVVFGSSIKVIEQFGTTSATSVGLSKQAAFEALGTFGNLFTALGSTRKASADMSITTVRLAADLASFNNIGVDEALERLRSGLVGEIEPLRRLGVSFNAAQVEAKALTLGLADANGEVSESAKVQARLALILEQSSNATGDFARTSDGLANRQRIVSAQWQDMQAQLGQVLLPVLTEVLGVVSSLMGVFTELDPTIQTVIVGFGVAAVGIGAVTSVMRTLGGAIAPVGTAFTNLTTLALNPFLAIGALVIGTAYGITTAFTDARVELDLNAAALDRVTNKQLVSYILRLQEVGVWAGDTTAVQRAFNQILEQSEEGAQRFIDAMGQAGINTDAYTKKLEVHIREQARANAEMETSKKRLDDLKAGILALPDYKQILIDITANIPGGSLLGPGGLLQFAGGGTVPGPIGVPRLVVAHGGETVTPPGQSTSIAFNISVAGVSDPGVGRAVGNQIGQGAADALARRGVIVAARTGGG